MQLRTIYTFYRDGFSSMVVGKTLWKIIFLKVFIMFAVLKVFFFPDFLGSNFTSDAERSNYVIQELTASRPPPDSRAD